MTNVDTNALYYKAGTNSIDSNTKFSETNIIFD